MFAAVFAVLTVILTAIVMLVGLFVCTSWVAETLFRIAFTIMNKYTNGKVYRIDTIDAYDARVHSERMERIRNMGR